MSAPMMTTVPPSLAYYLKAEAYDGSWSYTVNDFAGTGAPPPTRATPVVLGDPFFYVWSFVDEQIPGHLTPATASITLGGLSVAVLPSIEIGDLVTLQLTAGAPGATTDRFTLLRTTMRVSGVEADVDPHRTRPAVLTVALVDPLADLAGPALAYGGNPRNFGRERFALIGFLIGRSIGCPTGLSDYAFSGTLAYLIPNATALDVLTSLCNSSAGSDVSDPFNGIGPITLTSHVGAYPAGYEYVRPVTWLSGDPIPDPTSDVKYLISRCTRKLTVDPAPLAARYCLTPSHARKGREHVTDAVTLQGYEQATNSGGEPLEYKDLAWQVTGPPSPSVRTRVVPTQNVMGIYDRASGNPTTRPLVDTTATGQAFLSDATARAAAWTFDNFTVLSDRIPLEEAVDILPALLPNPPGYGAPALVRRLTITDLPASIRLDGTSELSGFLTKGAISINSGQLRHQVTTAPGNHTP